MSSRKDNVERRISDRAADEAGAWDARLRALDCTDEDRARFAQWRDASAENRAAFEKAQAIVVAFRSSMGRADVRALRDAALATLRRRRRKRVWTTAAAAVATLVVAIATWTTLSDFARQTPFQQLAALADVFLGRDGVYETGVGQRSTVTLQDGSAVELNAKTRIKVAFTEATRTVQLIDGQALFHVARNPQRPFIVRAADRDITAVGTAFDVRLDASFVRVTLLEGKVRVSKDSYIEPGAGGAATPPAPADAAVAELLPGQQFVARLSGSREQDDARPQAAATAESPEILATQDAVVRAIDVSKVTGWRGGRIFLEDLTLSQAVAEMNKYSEVQLRVADPALAAIRINGMFRAGDQRGFAAALEQYLPIEAQQEGDTDIALRQRR